MHWFSDWLVTTVIFRTQLQYGTSYVRTQSSYCVSSWTLLTSPLMWLTLLMGWLWVWLSTHQSSFMLLGVVNFWRRWILFITVNFVNQSFLSSGGIWETYLFAIHFVRTRRMVFKADDFVRIFPIASSGNLLCIITKKIFLFVML